MQNCTAGGFKFRGLMVGYLLKLWFPPTGICAAQNFNADLNPFAKASLKSYSGKEEIQADHVLERLPKPLAVPHGHLLRYIVITSRMNLQSQGPVSSCLASGARSRYEAVKAHHSGCSQNYGLFLAIGYIRHLVFWVPKWDPNLGNYPLLRLSCLRTAHCT